jgi:hypothetical protein
MSNQAHDNAGRLLILAHELKMARIMPIDSEVSAEPRATVPHACPSADEWCVPLSLRIVAFAFILVGTLSVVEMLLGWFVFSQIRIDFLFVGIFIGRGLLKWRESSRGWALFFTWLTLALISFWFAMAGYVVLGGQLPRGTWVGGASAYGLIAGTCIFAYLIWQLRTLRRTDIVTRFRNARLKHVLSNEGISQPVRRGRWQFSISSLMLATVVMAFVLVRLTSDDLLYDTQHVRSSRRVGNSIHGLEYGVRSPAGRANLRSLIERQRPLAWTRQPSVRHFRHFHRWNRDLVAERQAN